MCVCQQVEASYAQLIPSPRLTLWSEQYIRLRWEPTQRMTSDRLCVRAGSFRLTVHSATARRKRGYRISTREVLPSRTQAVCYSVIRNLLRPG